MRGVKGLHIAALAVMLALAAAPALAQTGPFGVGLPEQGMGTPGEGAFGTALAYIAERQAQFYRGLTGAVRALKEDGGAVWLLAGLSFLYGVFHAAGPGHGKAVLTSYILADGATLKRGVALSFAAAAVQATTAVLVVSILALALNATGIAMTNASWWLEVGSYALVMLIGLWLIASKTGLADRLRPAARRPASLGAAAVMAGHGSDCSCCGHAHMPDGRRVGAMSRREAATTVFAIGIRPCTGAIIVLVFALAQGLFLAGIASAYVMALGTAITVATIAAIAVLAKRLAVHLLAGHWGSGAGVRATKAVEIGGAMLVFLFGLTLFVGAMAQAG